MDESFWSRPSLGPWEGRGLTAVADGGVKVFTIPVDDNDCMVMRCPACNRKHAMSVAKFKGKKTLIKVRCHCNELFALELEFQKAPAVSKSYSGRFENCSQGHTHGQIQIATITDQVMEFSTQGRCSIHKGDKLKVDYHDPGAGFKKIKKNVIVKAVRGTHITCYFV